MRDIVLNLDVRGAGVLRIFLRDRAAGIVVLLGKDRVHRRYDQPQAAAFHQFSGDE